MIGSFSGMISTEDVEPRNHKHISIKDNDVDSRIFVVKEYLEKIPEATLKDIRTKALIHFSKPSNEELKSIIQSASIDKYNELFPIINSDSSIPIILDRIPSGAPLIREEILFLGQNKHYIGNNEFIFNRYKKLFPNSERKVRFIRDYHYHEQIGRVKREIKHTYDITSSQSTLTQTIRSLYKAGFTTENIHKVKPVITELLTQTSNHEEIQLAIEFLKE